MKITSIIAPVSSNPVTVNHTTDPNWNKLDVVNLDNISGDFEVRAVDTQGQRSKVYSLMPMPVE